MKKFYCRYPATVSLCILSFCIAGLAFIHGCTKPEVPSNQNTEPAPTITSTFFTTTSPVDPVVAAIAASLRQQDVKGAIEASLSGKAGFPIWNKAMVVTKEIVALRGDTTNCDRDDKIVLIPFVPKDARQTNAILKANLVGSDTLYQLIYAGQYEAFGFDKAADQRWNAIDIFHLFSKFDKAIFGTPQFLVKDRRLLTEMGVYNKDTAIMTLLENKKNAGRLVPVTVCDDYDVCLKECKGFKPTSGSLTFTQACCIEWGTRSICTPMWIESGDPLPVTPVGGGATPSPLPGGNSNSLGGSVVGGTSSSPIPDPCTLSPYLGTPGNLCFIPDAGWTPLPLNPAPYILTPDDRRIFDEITQEDKEADAVWNKNCQGTNRSGNAKWPGTIEHWLIMIDYVTQNPMTGQVEYQIPKSGPAGGRGWADIVNTNTGEIFEIKPDNETGQALGESEVALYVEKAREHCPSGASSPWRKGTDYAYRLIPNPTNPTQYIRASLLVPGVIGYFKVPRLDNLPVVLPSTILEKLKKLIEKLKENVGNYEPVIAKFLRENPDLVTYLKTAAFTAAIAIVVATIVEDFLTLGAGIADDWASFWLAYKIVRFAWKL